MTTNNDYPKLTKKQWETFLPWAQTRYEEFIAKDGDPEDLTDFWNWLTGAFHRCPAWYEQPIPGEEIWSPDVA